MIVSWLGARWLPWAACAALAVLCVVVYWRGEARARACEIRSADFKSDLAQQALAQQTAIARQSAAEASAHLENTRALVAAASSAKERIREIVVSKECSQDDLARATAAAVGLLLDQGRPGAGPYSGRPDPAGALRGAGQPRPAGQPNRQ